MVLKSFHGRLVLIATAPLDPLAVLIVMIIHMASFGPIEAASSFLIASSPYSGWEWNHFIIIFHLVVAVVIPSTEILLTCRATPASFLLLLRWEQDGITVVVVLINTMGLPHALFRLLA